MGQRRRSPVVSGIFYPDNRESLVTQLVSWNLINGAEKPVPGNSKGKAGGAVPDGQAIVVPHGAWDRTGNIAAAAFAAVQKNMEKTGQPIRRVLLLGTSHPSRGEGIFLSESVLFETPIGDLKVDLKLNGELASCSALITVNDIPHLSEHSLEVILPLVKYCFPKVKITPILMNGKRLELISALAGALKTVFGKCMEDCLVIISSNVSHDKDPATALAMANEFSSTLFDMDAASCLERLAASRINACGGALVASLLESGLFGGRRFSALCPLTSDTNENGAVVYCGAFGCI